MQDENAPGDRPADEPQERAEETQRMPDLARSEAAPWAQEPARPDPPPPAPERSSGTETISFTGMPGVPSPYETPVPPPPAAPSPAPSALLPPPYTPPPGYTPPSPYGATPTYTPPPVYGPTPGAGVPPGAYGGYGPAPYVPPANSTALGAMICGILAIVLACSAGPLGAILGGISLLLVSQYTRQQHQQPQQMVNPSDATYVQVGRVTGIIGLVIGLLYTLLIGCYLLFIFIAILGTSSSSYP